jgi:E3 ubiquitin-protein ligase RNF14
VPISPANGVYSIWPDELKVARRQDLVQLTMPVHPDLGGTVQTMVYPHGPQDPVAQLSLDYLPPLSLHVRLAPSYPFIPPDVRITWPWLASRDPTWRRAVEADLHALWQEGEPCIYAYIDHLQSQLLNPLARPLKLFEPPAVPRRGHPTFAARLTTYNTMRKTSSFQEGSYACCICLEERKGKHCVTLESCQHLFCRNCIEMMCVCFVEPEQCDVTPTHRLSIAIAEGSLDAIACPDPACSKIKAAAAKADSLVTVVATSTIAAYEVERIVSAAAYKRYLWLLDKRRFDAGASPPLHVAFTVPSLLHRSHDELLPEMQHGRRGAERGRLCDPA